MNSHEVAVRTALRAGDDIDRLIARLGTAQHPRGEVLVAYRNAHRSLRDVYGRPGPMVTREVGEVMRELRRVLATVAAESLADAVATGQTHARQQAKAQGLDVPMGVFAPAVDTAAMAAAWLATVDQQAAAVTALTATGADEDEILGDDSRAGVLRPAPVIAEGSRWVASAVTTATALYFAFLLGRQPGGRQITEDFRPGLLPRLSSLLGSLPARAEGQQTGRLESLAGGNYAIPSGINHRRSILC
jgi:hypothetical protein